MDSSYNLFRRTTPDWMRVLIASAIAIAMLVLNGPPIVRDALAWAFVTPVQRVVHTARVWVADYLVHGYQVQSLALQNRDLVAQNEGYAMRLHTLASVEGSSPALPIRLFPQRRCIKWLIRICANWCSIWVAKTACNWVSR